MGGIPSSQPSRPSAEARAAAEKAEVVANLGRWFFFFWRQCLRGCGELERVTEDCFMRQIENQQRSMGIRPEPVYS